MAHKDRKGRNMRGSRTYGYGNTQKHRGAGSRGGRGMAGSKKHKWMHVSKYMPGYFGRSGFKRPESQVKDVKAINVGYISENLKPLFESGFLKKDKDFYVVNLGEKGFNKLLGAGRVSNKFVIEVGECSEKARLKIEAAGGRVVLPSAGKEEAA